MASEVHNRSRRKCLQYSRPIGAQLRMRAKSAISRLHPSFPHLLFERLIDYPAQSYQSARQTFGFEAAVGRSLEEFKPMIITSS
jgi:hypothetical protein